MINLDALRDEADAGLPTDVVPITRRMLAQMAKEIAEGRAAQAMTRGQKQMDAMINNVRFERRIGEAAPVVDPIICDLYVLDAGEGA